MVSKSTGVVISVEMILSTSCYFYITLNQHVKMRKSSLMPFNYHPGIKLTKDFFKKLEFLLLFMEH